VAFSQLQSAPNSFSAGAPHRTPLGELTALPQTSYSWFKGDLLLRGGGGEGKMSGGRGRGGEGKGREGRGRPPYRKFLYPPLFTPVYLPYH